MRKVLLVGLVLVAGWSCSSAPQTAASRAQSIEAQVWSPYCPGRLLIDCSTTQARNLRATIQERVDRGDSAEEILTWVRGQFGPEAIARPDSSGRGLAIWVIPLALIVAAAILLAGVVRRWSRRTDLPSEPAPAGSERSGVDWTERVRDEVRRTL